MAFDFGLVFGLLGGGRLLGRALMTWRAGCKRLEAGFAAGEFGRDLQDFLDLARAGWFGKHFRGVRLIAPS